jgi:hypothetical protein
MVNKDRKKGLLTLIGTIVYEIISVIEEENQYTKRSVITEHLLKEGLIEDEEIDWAIIRKEIEGNDYGVRYVGKFRGRRYYLDSTPPENHNVDEVSDVVYQILKDNPTEMRMTEIMAKLEEKGKEEGVTYMGTGHLYSSTTHIQGALYQKFPNEFMRGSKRGFWMLKGTHEINDPNFPNYCSDCGHGLIGKPKFCSQCGVKIKFRSWV